jgi:hypothetical protein
LQDPETYKSLEHPPLKVLFLPSQLPSHLASSSNLVALSLLLPLYTNQTTPPSDSPWLPKSPLSTYVVQSPDMHAFCIVELLADILRKQYTMYGHIAKLAEAEKKGIEEAGGKVDVYQYVHTPDRISETWRRDPS